jgi:CheY-like chemotaxis protein
MENQKQILLIEDNKHDQYFFKQALREIEYATLLDVANNGKEALEILTTNLTLPDIIFTDLHMPVMDGIEYLTLVTKIPLVKDIPVVVLSSDSSKMATIRDLGARAFIEKPTNCDILQKLVEYVLSMGFMTHDAAAGSLGFQFIRSDSNMAINWREYR